MTQRTFIPNVSTNDVSVKGSWIEIALLADGTQLTGMELASWKSAQRPNARQDSTALVPEIIAVVRTQYANITVECGRSRPTLNLDALGPDLMFSIDLRQVAPGERVSYVERAEQVADSLNCYNDCHSR